MPLQAGGGVPRRPTLGFGQCGGPQVNGAVLGRRVAGEGNSGSAGGNRATLYCNFGPGTSSASTGGGLATDGLYHGGLARGRPPEESTTYGRGQALPRRGRPLLTR